MPASVFSLLCTLDHFDLSRNSIDQTTLTGWVACNMNNLKDEKILDASSKGLKGA